MAITLNCKKGNAEIRIGKNRVQILTGRRRKWDVLHWSRYSDDDIAVQGLYRGRYADAVVHVSELISALESLGADSVSEGIRKACSP